MKHPLFKSVLFLGSALALLNCGDDQASINTPSDIVGDQQGTNPNINSSSSITQGNPVVTEPCWLLQADQAYLINTSFVVSDANGNIVGIYDPNSQAITTIDGTPIIEGIDLSILPVVTPEEATQPGSSASSSSMVTVSSSSVILPSVESSSSAKQEASSSSEQKVEVSGNVTVTGSLTQTVAQTTSTSEIKFTGLTNEPSRLSWNVYFLETSYSNGTYTIKAATVPEYFETGEASEFFKVDGKDYEFKLTVTPKGSNGGNNQQPQSSNSAKSSSSANSSSSQQQQQSSSSVKSSSSVSSSSVRSSSSSASQPMSSYNYTNTAAYEAIRPIAGGKTGSGFASRYWDCCKPSCAWPGKGGLKATACDARGSKISDDGATSMCNGGNAGTCTSQIPMVVNDTLAYAYAAVPAKDGGACGKCFALKFTGKGKYETKANHRALATKTLVVMASNVGEDVAQGQFDVMIPGGGVGLFNGCANMGWGNMGAQYGGLLTECEKSAGSSGDLLTKRKECLVGKCNTTFANDPVAKEGCMFLATWYEAAGNPTHTYQEVECPSALKAKF